MHVQVTALGDVQLSRAVYNLTRAQDARVLAGYRVDWQPNQQPAYVSLRALLGCLGSVSMC